jgi:very-short-patch-repair endonuclease
LEEFPLPGEGLYLDFFLPSHMIAIEVQGTQHTKYNPFFHKDRAAFLDGQKRDRRKASWCEINKIRLVLIDYNETTENIIKKINLALK